MDIDISSYALLKLSPQNYVGLGNECCDKWLHNYTEDATTVSTKNTKRSCKEKRTYVEFEKFSDCFYYKTTKRVTIINVCALSQSIVLLAKYTCQCSESYCIAAVKSSSDILFRH